MAYAELSDIETRWRPLTNEEQPRAQALLEQASRLVRNKKVLRIDARLADLSLDPDFLADVIVGMVTPALSAGVGAAAPVTQKSVTVGGITTSTSFASAAGGSVLLGESELQLLMPEASNRGRAFAVDLWPTP